MPEPIDQPDISGLGSGLPSDVHDDTRKDVVNPFDWVIYRSLSGMDVPMIVTEVYSPTCLSGVAFVGPNSSHYEAHAGGTCLMSSVGEGTAPGQWRRR